MDEKIYMDSLIFKLKSANYHRETSLVNLKQEMYKVDQDEDKLVAISSEFIAMMLSLHSCLDVLGQLINIKKTIGLDENNLYFRDVINFLKPGELKKKLIELNRSTDYLRAFCNTIKHKNIVNVSHYTFFLSPIQPSATFDIDEFKKYGSTYPPETLEYQLNKQYDLVNDQINDILKIL